MTIELKEFSNKKDLIIRSDFHFDGTILDFKFSMEGEALKKVLCPAFQKENLNDRKDELWKSTCFEFFIGSTNGSYEELNISPSGHWQAYFFHSYRSAPQPSEGRVLNFSFLESKQTKTFRGRFQVASARDEGKIKIAPTAVVAFQDSKNLSYFAPQHPLKTADFHDSKYWISYEIRKEATPKVE